jgi:hypothetical protein
VILTSDISRLSLPIIYIPAPSNPLESPMIVSDIKILSQSTNKFEPMDNIEK